MEKRILKLYRRDCALIIISVMALWLVLLSVMAAVSSLGVGQIISVIALGSGITAGTVATVSLFALLRHLRKNQQDIYSEDILCSDAVNSD
jgi:hypothetical protein